MSNLDYPEIERKLGRKLKKHERKYLVELEHQKMGLPNTRGAIKAIERRKRTLANTESTRSVQGGAPGLGKRNSGNLFTVRTREKKS